AVFLDPARRHAWRRWKFDWLTPKEPGRYTLLSRANGADGSAQPDQHDPNYGAYVITHLLPIEVFVDGPAGTPGEPGWKRQPEVSREREQTGRIPGQKGAGM